MAEKRLGRGLDFLLARTRPEEPTDSADVAAKVPQPGSTGPAHELSLDSIEPNPFQPRREFTAEALADLEASIRVHGVLQPVVVRRKPQGDGYQLVAGERRFRASAAAGLKSIPAVIKEISDDSLLAIALVENLQRENLNPMEVARGYQRLLAVEGTTQEQVAAVVGKSRVSVANTIRLIDLPEDLQEHVSRGTLSAGHARALLAIGEVDAMRALAQRILVDGLSVREAEAEARGDGGLKPQGRPVPPALLRKSERSSHLEELEDRLRKCLGTRVTIKPGRGKRGKIVLQYASLEDFDRIYEILAGAEADRPVAPAPDTKYF
jgi:ParB family chromosome partitioning protein